MRFHTSMVTPKWNRFTATRVRGRVYWYTTWWVLWYKEKNVWRDDWMIEIIGSIAQLINSCWADLWSRIWSRWCSNSCLCPFQFPSNDWGSVVVKRRVPLFNPLLGQLEILRGSRISSSSVIVSLNQLCCLSFWSAVSSMAQRYRSAHCMSNATVYLVKSLFYKGWIVTAVLTVLSM